MQVSSFLSKESKILYDEFEAMKVTLVGAQPQLNYRRKPIRTAQLRATGKKIEIKLNVMTNKFF